MKFGITKLFVLISILLKTIPKLGSAGFIHTFTLWPLCKPMPVKEIFFFIVF